MEVLKNALSTLMTITEKADMALEDGKISISEGVGIAMSAIGLVGIFKHYKEILEVYKNLTDADRKELAQWFKEEFDLRNDNVEELVEIVFAGIINMGNAFSALK